MKNAKCIALGILLVAGVGFAGTGSEEGAQAPDVAVDNQGQANEHQTVNRPAARLAPDQLPMLRFAAGPLSTPNAKQCKTVRANNSSDELDECLECWLDCQREWQACRRNCAPPEPGAGYTCHEACVDDLIWCQNTGCAPLCDS